MRDSASISERVAAFARASTFGELPDAVLELSRSLVKDQLACQVIGSKLSHNALVRWYALSESPPGKATIVRASAGARAEWAALANATAGHGIEMDDTHLKALAHPGCVLVPTVLATAEQQNSGGRDLLVALALGVETTIRVSLAVMPSMLTSRGFHETCVTGVFGAALASGWLTGLNVEQLTSALAIAGSHASGTIEYARSGGEVKRLHAGLGAMGGIRSARLAELGLTGPRRVFEGPKGVLQAVSAAPKPYAIAGELGVEWHLMSLASRERSVPFSMQGPIRAARQVIDDHRLKSDHIIRIVVGIDDFSAGHLGTLGLPPEDIAGAQFSLQYSLAMAIVWGSNDYQDYLRAAGDHFSNPEVLRVARLVEVTSDESSTSVFPDRLRSVVSITCNDGATHRAVGEAPTRWNGEMVTHRFRAIMTNEFGVDAARRLEGAVQDFMDDRPVRGALADLRSEM